VCAHARELTLIQAHDDTCIKRNSGWMVAHTGQRPRRRRGLSARRPSGLISPTMR
jgi:hypothetical protein